MTRVDTGQIKGKGPPERKDSSCRRGQDRVIAVPAYQLFKGDGDRGERLSLDFVGAGPHHRGMKFILSTHNVTLTKATDRQFKCSMRLAMPGPDLYAEDFETDLYAAIDLVAKKIEQQIRKRHNKYKARKHTERSEE